jgi:hypothetical protein
MEEIIINEFNTEYLTERIILLIFFMVVLERLREKIIQD